MKSVYAFHGPLLMMLVLSVLIFIATIPMGNGSYDTKKTQLKITDLKRGTFERERASDTGDLQSPSDHKNVKLVTITNGNSSKRGLRGKRKTTLPGYGISRSKRAKGRLKAYLYQLFQMIKSEDQRLIRKEMVLRLVNDKEVATGCSSW